MSSGLPVSGLHFDQSHLPFTIHLTRAADTYIEMIKEVDVAIVPRDGWDRRKPVLLRERLENLNIPYNVELVDFSFVSGKFREAALQNVIWWRK